MSVTAFIAQIYPIICSFKQNLQMIEDAIHAAKNDTTDVIVFPELALSNEHLLKIDVTQSHHITLSLESDLVRYLP